MINEFGVPASEHEMMMMKPHEKILAQSGVESNILGAIVSVGMGLWGANKSAKAAKKQLKQARKV